MPFINKPDLDRLIELSDTVLTEDTAAEVQKILHEAKRNMADPALREAAHDQYGTDEIEIDDEPAIASASGGTWVAAWVWMPDDEDEDDDQAD